LGGIARAPEKVLVMSAVPTVEQARSAGHYVVRPGAAAALDSTLKLAAQLTGYAVASVNVVDSAQVYRVGEFGESGDRTYFGATPDHYDRVPCGRLMLAEEALVIPDSDLARDAGGRPLIDHPPVRSYIGVPVRGREGLAIGVLCVMDSAAHVDASHHLGLLQELALVVEDQLELTRRRSEIAPLTPGASLHEIRAALVAGQIRPYYQPLVDVFNNRVIGFEVLARWEHSDGHLVSAEQFLPAAQDTELIVEIDRTMLTQALDEVSAWRPGLAGMHLSVNASGPWARSVGFVDEVLDALAIHGIPAQRLTIELTESVLLEREPRISANLAAIRAAGCRVALDDFGTGWSSMEYLLRLPVDELKIDRSFTAALGTPMGDSLVRSTTRLASELGLTCVVEGIEHSSQLRRICEMSSCFVGQGFYWSAAMSAGQLEQRLAHSAGAVA
jgi:EAL domain-containing protein (putative c-di-GMP-specific phosphodiesterase class I)